MTAPLGAVPEDAASRYSSLAELRAEHSALLKTRRDNGETPELLAAGADFIRRGRATGAVVDDDSDRAVGQSLLDYWSTLIYRAGYEPPDATLAEFDPSLAPELDDANCPYLGLDAFRENNQAVFFGRERLIDEWLARLRRDRFMAVVGSSGSGKSSLVLGGLMPKLKAGGVPGSQAWTFCPPFVPGSTPLAPLARIMLTSQDEFREDPQHLRKLADVAATPLVLVVDQFEELFTVCSSDTDRQAFVHNMLNLVAGAEVRHTVIVTMRSDFESNVVRLPDLEAIFALGTVRVTPLNAAELREAIEKPAELAGLKFQEGIVDELVKQILGEPVGLPLLQYTLLKLWETRARNRVTWEAFSRLGGAREALARSADVLYGGLIPEDQVTAKRILLRLVRPGEGLEVTSNRVRRTSLYPAGENPAGIDRVLDRFIAARLLRRTEGEIHADEQIEVAHEALVRNWPRLVDWLEEERVSLRRRLHLTAAAQQWEASGCDGGALWAGVLLVEAGRYDDLNDLEAQFIQASRAAIEDALREEAARQRELEQAQQLAEEQRRRTEAESMRAEMERQRAEERSRDARRLRSYVRIAIAGIILALCATAAAVTGLYTAQNARDEAQRTGAAALAARSDAVLAQQDATAQRDEANRQRANADAAAQQAQQQKQNAESATYLRAASQAASGDFSDVNLLVATQAYRAHPSPETLGTLLSVTHQVPELYTLMRGHTHLVKAVAVSPADGLTVASAGGDMSIILWDLRANPPRPRGQPLSGHTDTVQSVAFSPDGAVLASASSDHTIRLWDVASGRPMGSLLGHSATVWSVAFSPDGSLLASGSADGTVRLWDVTNQQQVSVLSGHAASVYDVAFSPDGALLASAGRDRTVRLWNVANRVADGDPLTEPDQVYALAFNARGTVLASAGLDGTISMWNLETRSRQSTLSPQSSAIFGLAFSPDGSILASVGADSHLLLWDALSGVLTERLVGHAAAVNSLAWAGAGTAVVTGSDDTTVGVWQPAIKQRAAATLDTLTGGALSLALSPDKQTVAAGASDGSVTLWDRVTGRSARTIAGRQNANSSTPAVNGVAFSPDGKTLASVSSDDTIKLWDVATGQLIGSPLMGHTDEVVSVAFSPSGKLLATGSLDKTVILWDLATQSPLATLGKDQPTGKVDTVAFSPDGSLLASGSDDSTIVIWDVASLRSIDPPMVGHAGTVRSVAFSPDGKTLVSGGDDDAVRFWDVQTHLPLQIPIHGHARAVTSVAFSADGRTVASASRDRTIILWDAATGQPIGVPLVGHRASVTSLVFDSSASLLSGSLDQSIASWTISGDGLANVACGVANRNLTVREWREAFGELPYAQTCPTVAVNLYAISGVIGHAESLLAMGDTGGAESAYALAVGWAETTKNWSLNNALCWFGSLDGLAQTVMPTCERAVEVAPDSQKPYYRDARGVARAQVQDFQGAIDDLQSFADWANPGNSGVVVQAEANERRQFISELKAGRNPFADPAVVDRLHSE